jgi:hypothetical protein
MESPENTLAYCRQLLSLYEMEAITEARVARVYYDSFQICITHDDQAQAKRICSLPSAESDHMVDGADSAFLNVFYTQVCSEVTHDFL